MTEEKIITWMRERINKDNFTDAASLAGDFLREHNITNALVRCSYVGRVEGGDAGEIKQNWAA